MMRIVRASILFRQMQEIALIILEQRLRVSQLVLIFELHDEEIICAYINLYLRQ
jgi:hypothetical protein